MAESPSPEPAPTSPPPPDPDALKRYAFNLFTKLEGAVTSGMVHLGDRLGLYRALADAAAPTVGSVSSAELADRAGLDERWVREWAYNQAAAGLIDIDDEERFSLSAEALAVLVDESSPAFGMGQFTRFPGPDGHPGRDAGRVPRRASATTTTATARTARPGSSARSSRGTATTCCRWACPRWTASSAGWKAAGPWPTSAAAAGIAVCLMAEAFPSSQVHGYEISRLALDRAERRRAELGLANAHFHDARAEPLPSDGSVDLVTTFDCIHDMTRPQEMMDAIRASLRDDGIWLLVDIKARDSYAENVAKNPMTALMYGISVLSCLSSALSEPGGAGLGTLGLPESQARAMAEAAGLHPLPPLGHRPRRSTRSTRSGPDAVVDKRRRLA